MKSRSVEPLSKEQLFKRRKFLGATFVSLLVVSLVFGTVHVLSLGSNRMQQMRDQAAYDLSEESNKIRAAGEDLFRTDDHDKGRSHKVSYTVEEAHALLSVEQKTLLDQMAIVEAGEFTMGTNDLKSDVQNRPEHKVFLEGFKIDTFLVTNGEYARFVAANGYRPPINWVDGKIKPGSELNPVTMISWYDARKYCEWEGKRLPTETEWEKAARGVDGRRWPWGDKMDSTKLNTYYNVGNTTEVTKYISGISPYGVYDLSGNVQEWVEDDFLPYAGTNASDTLFKAKKAVVSTDEKQQKMKVADFVVTEDRYKVMRGGSWKSDPFSTSAYHRNFSMPQMTSDFYGFRCASN